MRTPLPYAMTESVYFYGMLCHYLRFLQNLQTNVNMPINTLMGGGDFYVGFYNTVLGHAFYLLRYKIRPKRGKV